MDLPSTASILTLLAGAVIAGEALVLFMGMYLLNGEDNPWKSPKNNFFLIIDILSGTALIILVLTIQERFNTL